MQRILVWPDWHLPRHSKKATEEAMYFAKQYKPHTFVHLGDMWDNHCVSGHPKNPATFSRLVDEISAGEETLAKLDTVLGRSCKRHITVGNHDAFLQRYIWRQAGALDGLVDLSDALLFRKYGFQVTPYRRLLKIGHIYFNHDIGGAGAMAAERALHKVQGCIIQGHNHRAKVVYETNARGKSRFGATLGWLGDPECALDYMHEHDASTQWTHCFGTLDMANDGTAKLSLHPLF